MPSIEIRGVTRDFLRDGIREPALRGIDLTISAGEFVAIVGRSGSGKTTLLNLLAGIDHPTTGEVLVFGNPVHRFSEKAGALWRSRHVGLVFQFFQLLPTLTIAENVVLPMDFAGAVPARDRDRRARQLLAQVGVAEHADKLPAMLSGGQQQRAALARALANDPPLIVADEPTGNLDSATGAAVFALLAALAAEGKTVILVTHERDIAAHADRVVTLCDGVVSADVATSSAVRRGGRHG